MRTTPCHLSISFTMSRRNRDLDLLLHTTGGSINAAEKLMGMMRNRVGTAKLRIIVPDFAKSAGTLMVLGADSVGDERHV